MLLLRNNALALLLNLLWEKTEPKPPLALDAQRVAKIEAPAAIEFEKKEVKKQKEEEAQKSTEKEGQTKRAKEHRALLAALEVGAEVATNGGIPGKVTQLQRDGHRDWLVAGLREQAQIHRLI